MVEPIEKLFPMYRKLKIKIRKLGANVYEQNDNSKWIINVLYIAK